MFVVWLLSGLFSNATLSEGGQFFFQNAEACLVGYDIASNMEQALSGHNFVVQKLRNIYSINFLFQSIILQPKRK